MNEHNPLRRIKPTNHTTQDTTNTDAIQPTKTTNPHPTPQPTTNNHTPNTWHQHANCRGKNHLMFPQKHKDIEYLPQARQICQNCPVKTPCLEEALQYPTIDMHGVWAGLTSRQLAAEQRRRGITPTKPTIAAIWNHHK